jgi:3-hydroxyisobutyrate dehydrogenase-like beta-hydroxyacid dehydrogenase
MKAGFVGLGHMGGAMARRLLAAGVPLTVYDRDISAREAFSSLGATVVADAKTVADHASIVFVCLPSPEATRDVANQLVAGSSLRVLVETSTVGPAAVRELALSLSNRGAATVDAPVSGGPRGAEAGTLAIMHSGQPDVVAEVLPLLRAIAGRVFHVGSEPGLAQLCKLVNNMISAAGMIAACEAMVVGVKAGLDAEMLLAAVNAGSGRNSATLDKFPASILPGTFDYGGPMGLMLKDLALYLEEARAQGVESALAPAVLGAWQEAVRRNGAEADYSMVIRHFEIDAGVQVRALSAKRKQAHE